MKKYILFFLVLMPFASMAQSGVFTPYSSAPIVIDTFSHKSATPLPFDRNFTLQYTLKPTDSIFRLFTYQVKMVRGTRDLIPTLISTSVPTPYGFINIPLPGYVQRVSPWDTIKNVIIINEKALNPNTLIDVAILKKLNKREMDSLMLINENLYLRSLPVPSGLTMAQIQGLHTQFITNITATTFPGRTPFNKPNWVTYQKYFTKDLLPYYTGLHATGYFYTDPVTRAAYDFRAAITFADLKTFDQQLTAVKIADDDLLPFASLVKENVTVQLLDGTADLSAKYPADIQTLSSNYQKRITNLTTALTYLDKLISLLHKAQLNNIVLPANLYDQVLAFRALTLANRNLLRTNYGGLVNTIRSNSDLSKEFWLMSENDFTDLTLLSKNLFLPDLGIATLVLKGHEQYQIYPRPFIGVNVYFRPVDKTLKESYFDKKDVWRLLSLQVGFTYGKLGGKEFSNLFNDFNLMAGPSVRLVRWFRLGLGTVMTQQTDANPIINQAHTSFGYYMALSFDVDILSNAATAQGRVYK